MEKSMEKRGGKRRGEKKRGETSTQQQIPARPKSPNGETTRKLTPKLPFRFPFLFLFLFLWGGAWALHCTTRAKRNVDDLVLPRHDMF